MLCTARNERLTASKQIGVERKGIPEVQEIDQLGGRKTLVAGKAKISEEDVHRDWKRTGKGKWDRRSGVCE